MNDNANRKIGLNWRVAALIFLGVIAVWLLSWYYLERHYKVATDAGPFGDMFGFINSLFSGLAFAGIIITILLQREELKAQREELQLNTGALNAQKEELKAQREEFEKQNRNLTKQNFENSFFNCLDAKDTLVSMLNERSEHFFEKKYGELDSYYKTHNHNQPIVNIRSFFYGHEWLIGHHFRNVIIILKMIDKCNLDEASKTFYISILQARMSNDELRVFLYNIISELKEDEYEQPGSITHRERVEIQALIKKYEFFEVLRPRLAVGLIDSSDWELLRQLVYGPLL